NDGGKPHRRPAPNAVLRLAELGTIPVRPGPVTTADAAAAPYLPPERLVTGGNGPPRDIHRLRATMYFLLPRPPPLLSAAPPPPPGAPPAARVDRGRSPDPAPLASLRPDLPQELADLLTRMMHKQPEMRPLTMADVETELARFCRPGTVQADVPDAMPASSSLSSNAVPVAEEVDVWAVGSGSLSMADSSPRVRPVTADQRRRNRMLLILGGLLHLTAIALIIAWALGAFESPPDPSPGTSPSKTDNYPSKK